MFVATKKKGGPPLPPGGPFPNTEGDLGQRAEKGGRETRRRRGQRGHCPASSGKNGNASPSLLPTAILFFPKRGGEREKKTPNGLKF